jgi:hypothetical protein
MGQPAFRERRNTVKTRAWTRVPHAIRGATPADVAMDTINGRRREDIDPTNICSQCPAPFHGSVPRYQADNTCFSLPARSGGRVSRHLLLRGPVATFGYGIAAPRGL